MIYSRQELKKLGFTRIGKNVQISKLVKFYALKGKIGANSRIDDYCIIKGNIEIGRNVHIGAFSYLAAVGSNIKIKELTGVSARCTFIATSDDFIGNYLTNPTVDKKFRKIIKKDILIGRNVSIGTGAIILPGAKIKDSASIISGSIVNQKIKSGYIYGNVRVNKYYLKKKIELINKKIRNFKKK